MTNRPTADAEELQRFGYAQELVRRLGGFSSFAIGFSVISVLTGIASTFGDALAAGGPAGLGLGWPLVSFGTLLVGLAMAELASAFPTAGALYHWAALLGGPAWGWSTAMLNLAGQLAIVAAIDLACAQALAHVCGGSDRQAYALFLLVLVVHGGLNATSVRLVAWLNDASASVHVVGVGVLAAWLFAKGVVHPPAYLAHVTATSTPDGNYALGFVQSLVLGVWTFTGFDAAAHVSEETHDPGRRAPLGILTAIGGSAIAGFALVAALTLSIRDPKVTAAAPDAALEVLRTALGPQAGRAAMALVVLAMWFAGLSSVTSASRMLFAFARDGGVPLAPWLRKVSGRTRTPLNATVACVVLALVLVFATAPLSEAVFLVVAALATIALYASYALPIVLGATARTRGRWTRRGPFNLGPAGVPLAWAAVAWTVMVALVCTLANRQATEVFAGLLAVLAALWTLHVRGRFSGPKVDLAHFERAPDHDPVGSLRLEPGSRPP
ncbi:MAG TPA: amino acid permease [Polyangiaceae bacterium]|nr:amino acid permease [Polyangiaceae bacterium]